MQISRIPTRHSDSLATKRLDRGVYKFSVFIKPNPFVSGSFSLRLTCRGPRLEEFDTIDYAYHVNVVPNLEDDEALRERPGVVKIPFEWSSETRE